MDRVVTFIKDSWSLSADRIRRADPLLMGAAIAYNSLFALVPLAVAFIAILTIFDRTNEVLGELGTWLEANLAPDAAIFLNELLTESVDWLESSSPTLLVVSLLIALWSGSRAVYAVQKALRTVEGVEDPRGYFVTRALGIGVTVVAGIGVMVGYLLLTAGERVWQWVEDSVGVGTTAAIQVTTLVIAIAWGWGLLWAIYRWGPPHPIRRAGLVSALVAALLVLGSYLAFNFVPTNANALAVFGVIGVILIWLYYVGIVLVAAPTLIDSVIAAGSKQLKG